MTALDVGNVVDSTLGDTETTVTGLAVTIDEIIVEGNVLFTNGFINGVTDNSYLPGIVIKEESGERPDMCFSTIPIGACNVALGFEFILLSAVGSGEEKLLTGPNFSVTHVMLLLMLMLLVDSDNEAGIFDSKFLLLSSGVEENTDGILGAIVLCSVSEVMVFSKSLFLSRKCFELVTKTLLLKLKHSLVLQLSLVCFKESTV